MKKIIETYLIPEHCTECPYFEKFIYDENGISNSIEGDELTKFISRKGIMGMNCEMKFPIDFFSDKQIESYNLNDK